MENENKNKSELSVLLKYKATMIKWSIIALVIIVALVAIFFKGYSNAKDKYEVIVAELRDQLEEKSKNPAVWDETPTKEITLSLIESEIKDIGELATLEYLYTDAGKFEDPHDIFGINIPFTTKSIIAKWDGVIKAGVEIKDIDVELDHSAKEIIIHMPEAKILSHEIDDESMETLDEKDGLFNPVKVDDVRELDKTSKDKMEERAIENGILDKAFENAKDIIEKLVNNDVVQEQGYSIKFEIIK